MKLGSIVETMRKAKGMTIKEVIGEEISRSAYYRFVTGESDTSTRNLTFLLNNLNISFEELGNLGYFSSNIDIQQISFDIKLAFEERNIIKIRQLRKLYNRDGGFTSKETHLYCFMGILIKRLENKEFDIFEDDLYQYLISVESWTHYEIALYNNTMYAFPLNINKIILEKAVMVMRKHSIKSHYGNEVFRLLCNSVVLFLSHKELEEAWKYMNQMNQVELTEDSIFERTFKLLINGVVEKILTPEYKNNKVIIALEIFDAVGSDRLYKMNKELLESLEELYEVKFK